MEKHGILAIDVMGSVGSGKTTMIEHLSSHLCQTKTVGVVAGDLTTTIDADRIEERGAQVVEVNTGKECHLDANLVGKALRELPLEKLDLLFIENVGNLICPAEFALGEHHRAMLLSLPEGHDKPQKYPLMFTGAEVILLNKTDLAPYLDFDTEAFTKVVTGLNPDVKLFLVSCKTGDGLEKWYAWLESEATASH